MAKFSVTLFGNRRISTDLSGLYELINSNNFFTVTKLANVDTKDKSPLKSFSSIQDSGDKKWGALDSSNKQLSDRQFKEKLSEQPDVLIYVMEMGDIRDASLEGMFGVLNSVRNAKYSTIIIGIPTAAGGPLLGLSNENYYKTYSKLENGITDGISNINSDLSKYRRVFIRGLDNISSSYVNEKGFFTSSAKKQDFKNNVFQHLTNVLNSLGTLLTSNPPASTTTSSTKKSGDKKDATSSAAGGALPGGDTSAAASSAPATPATPQPPSETEEEKRERERKIITASKMRINEQAALIINAPTLLYTKPAAGKDSELSEVPAARQYANFATYRNGASGTGGHIDFSKNVLKGENHRYFLKEVPPHILSSLTPSIKIYKVFYPNEKMFSPNSQGFSWRVPFDELSVPYKAKIDSSGKEILLTSKLLNPTQTDEKKAFKQQALDEILNGNSRFHGVGIKSFRYAFKGTNPAEINTNIDAELELYLQDVRDIVKEYEITNYDSNFVNVAPGEIRSDVNLKFSYADLIADVPARVKDRKLNKEIYNTDYYRIKIAVGYAVPPEEYLKNLEPDPKRREAIIESIKKSAVFLYLNPYNHDITFEENGAITLKIKYISAMTVQTSVINCLHIAKNSYKKLLESQKKLDEIMSSSREAIRNISLCGELTRQEREAAAKQEQKAIEPLLEKAKTELEMNKNSIYTEIFSRLTGVIDNNTVSPPVNTTSSNSDVKAQPSNTPEKNARSRVYEVIFDSQALGLTSKGELKSKAKPYENMQQLKKIYGYFLSEVAEKDSSWFLTKKPILPPIPVNVTRKKSPSEEAAEKAAEAAKAKAAEPKSSIVKPATLDEMKSLDDETKKNIQRQLNFIATKRKIRFKPLDADGKIGEKTLTLAKQLFVIITPSGYLYNSPKKTNLISEDFYKDIPSKKIIEIQKKLNQLLVSKQPKDAKEPAKLLELTGKFDAETMKNLSKHYLVVSDKGDLISSDDLSYSLSDQETEEFYNLEEKRIEKESEERLKKIEKESEENLKKIEEEEKKIEKEYQERIKKLDKELEADLAAIDRAGKIRERADRLLALNKKVTPASIKQLKKISKRLAMSIQNDLNALAFYKDGKIVKLQIDGKLGGKTLEMANFVNVIITPNGNIVTKPPVEEKKPAEAEGKKESDETDTGDEEEESSSEATKQKASEIAAKKLTEEAAKNIYVQTPLTGPYEGKFSVKFVFLGDIIDVFCEVLDDIEFSQDRPKLVLSNFQLELPFSVVNNVLSYSKETFNIADIPVSLEMLKTFLLERVIKPRSSNYNLFTMISHLISDIIPSSISPRYFGTKSILNRSIRVGMLGFAIPNDSSQQDAILSVPSTRKKFSGRITEESLRSKNIQDLIEIDNTNNLSNYSVLYCSNQLPNLIKKNNGGLKQDEESGIYHFYVGSDRGILKKVAFTRNNTPYYKEAKSQSSQGMKSLGRLQEVYNVSLTMFGNNIYKPGDFFFVEPLFFSGKTGIDLSNKIGLGGYYQVIDVETKISVGSYETKINAVLYGRLIQGEVLSEIEERACGDIREYAGG